jgi:hypothetical protein
MPLIMDRNGGFYTGFIVQNVGPETTTVDCVFTDTTYTVSRELAQGEALADLQLGKIAPGYVGRATCTADKLTGRLIAVVNELGSDPSADQLLVYEGIAGE